MPKRSYGFVEMGLEEEGGDSAPARDTRRHVPGPAFKDHMEYDFIVSRVFKVSMELPICDGSVKLHVAVICGFPDLNDRIAKIRSPIGIHPPRPEHLNRLIVGCPEGEAVEILTAPDVAEEPLMNVERELSHRER